MTRRLSLMAAALLIVLSAPPGAAAATTTWSSPLDGLTVDARFDPPADPYGPGHRGIDLVGTVGDVVRAVAPGQVTFAGPVGSVPVVTIDHGDERSTYQPVVASVGVGDAVAAGQVIGTLVGTHSHCPGACLHLGRIAGEEYLDPLELLGGGRFRLISPDGDPPPPPAGAGGQLIRPVGGPMTSPFGLRVHPVTGVRKLHDGTDFGAACGTPVHAAAAGVVIASGHDGAYGQRITVRHGPRSRDVVRPPVDAHRDGGCHGRCGRGHRPIRLDRHVNRLPPALHGHAGRPPREPAGPAVIRSGRGTHARGWAS